MPQSGLMWNKNQWACVGVGGCKKPLARPPLIINSIKLVASLRARIKPFNTQAFEAPSEVPGSAKKEKSSMREKCSYKPTRSFSKGEQKRNKRDSLKHARSQWRTIKESMQTRGPLKEERGDGFIAVPAWTSDRNARNSFHPRYK